MDTSLEEIVIGVRKADLNEVKELKVKIPVRLLINLHFVKLTESRGISEVVLQALDEYFASHIGVAGAKDLPANETAVQASTSEGAEGTG